MTTPYTRTLQEWARDRMKERRRDRGELGPELPRWPRQCVGMAVRPHPQLRSRDHPVHPGYPGPAPAARDQADPVDASDAGRPAEVEGAAAQVQREPAEDPGRDDAPLQGGGSQPLRGVPPACGADPDPVRLVRGVVRSPGPSSRAGWLSTTHEAVSGHPTKCRRGEVPGGKPGLLRPRGWGGGQDPPGEEWRLRSEEHTSELQSRENLVCRLLLEKKKKRTSMLLLVVKKEYSFISGLW